MSDTKWTIAQQNAIDCRGGTVLVSAAAGSGKTAVLVQRVIEILTDREYEVDANEILVVTFSSAAAAEMKERIFQRLTEMIQKTPNDTYLIRQRTLLSAAHISTVHAFCMDLARTNFHLLDISPDFHLGNEKEISLLQDEIAEEIIENYYENDDGSFSNLVELVSSTSDDKALMKALHTVYGFLRSHPFYHDWMDEKLLIYNANIPVQDTKWGEIILNYAHDAVDYSISLMQKAIEEIHQDEAMKKAYILTFESEISQFKNVASKIESGTWDEIYKAINDVSYQKLNALRNYENDAKKEFVQSLRKTAQDTIDGLKKDQFCCNSEEFCEDIKFLFPKINTLFELVKSYDERLNEEKGKRHIIDFSDLEHFAIKMLVEHTGGETYKTELSKKLSEKYKFVLIDEYQDTNETQDMIFRSLSREDNLFMVGDVKQSIYSFRQAMPELFIQKRNVFCDYKKDNTQYPAKIILSNNFRSRKEVTDSINYIFRAIMSDEVGEINYDDTESLVASAKYSENSDTATELHFIENEDEEISDILAEANYVAEKIEGLLDDKFQVIDGEITRDIMPKDICILLRTHKNKAELFTKALTEKGINTWSNSSSGFLQMVEISTCISILKAVDNPLIDIHLTAAMMSPAFGFTADEMSLIRLQNRSEHLYLNCCNLVKNEDNATEKLYCHCKQFLQTLEELRMISSTNPSHKILQKLIDKTGLWEIASAMKYGELRKANLRLLIDYAEDYELRGYKGSSGFLRFIDKLSERGDDLSSATAISDEGNAVQIMSIHRSKGLEFPVVFLCDSSKKFNKQDLYSNILLHSQLGFSCSIRDLSTRMQCTSIPMEAMRLELDRSTLSEEMRILYVAMTRAKEKLYITAIQNKLAKKISTLNIALTDKKTISPYSVRTGNSYADWLLMVLKYHPNSKEMYENFGLLQEELVTEPYCKFKIVISQYLSKEEEVKKENFEINEDFDECIKKDISLLTQWKYIDLNACSILSKLSVSQITKGAEKILPQNTNISFTKTPEFMKKQELNAAQRGTALHSYMSYAKHQDASKNLEKEINRLVEQKFITAKEGESLDRLAISKYYNSKLYQRVKTSQWVKWEFSFMMDLGKNDLEKIIPNIGEHLVTVQGIADLVFEENEGLILVDFKKDNTLDPQKLIYRYTGQLNLYARMISELTGKKINEKLLYSFTQNKEIIIEAAEI